MTGGDVRDAAGRFHIRPYRPADADAVTALWLESWTATGISDETITLAELRERWPFEIAGGWEVHVAAKGNALAGFIAFQDNVLEQLFVAPAHQGCGIGTRLLGLAKQRMPFGFRMTTAAESRAASFYEGEGLRRGGAATEYRFGHTIVGYQWSPPRRVLAG